MSTSSVMNRVMNRVGSFAASSASSSNDDDTPTPPPHPLVGQVIRARLYFDGCSSSYASAYFDGSLYASAEEDVDDAPHTTYEVLCVDSATMHDDGEQWLRVKMPCGLVYPKSVSMRQILASSILDLPSRGQRTMIAAATQIPSPSTLNEISPRWLRSVCQRPGIERVNKIHVTSEEVHDRRSSVHAVLDCFAARTPQEMGRPVFVLFGKFFFPSSSSSSSAEATVRDKEEERRRFARESSVYMVLNQITPPVAPVCFYSFASPTKKLAEGENINACSFGASANCFFSEASCSSSSSSSSILLLEELPVSWSQFAPRLSQITQDRHTGEILEVVPDVAASGELARIANSLAALHAPFIRSHLLARRQSNNSSSSSAFIKFVQATLCHQNIFRDALVEKLIVTRGGGEDHSGDHQSILKDILHPDNIVLVHGSLYVSSHVMLARDRKSNALFVDWKSAGMAPKELDLLHVYISLFPGLLRSSMLDLLLESYLSALKIFVGDDDDESFALSVAAMKVRLMHLAKALLRASSSSSSASSSCCCADWIPTTKEERIEMTSAFEEIKLQLQQDNKEEEHDEIDEL